MISRRGLILASSAMLVGKPAWSNLLPTAPSTEGPFYPVAIPPDHDNDLVRVASAAREAGGEVLNLNGRITDPGGRPVVDAVVEIWQCDANGIYLHPRDSEQDVRDSAFQGFGRAVTDAGGRFRFRTILPVPYTGRTPHIHAKVFRGGRELLTTQFYRKGHPQNEGDFLFSRMTAEQQQRVSMAIIPRPAEVRPEWETEILVVLPAA